MRSQNELLQGTGIPTDELPEHIFTQADEEFLATVEPIAFEEWSRASEIIVGLTASMDHIPDYYDKILRRQGQWEQDYTTIDKMQK